MYGNDVRRTLILGQYGTAVRSERNCSENTNVYGVRPITNINTYVPSFKSHLDSRRKHGQKSRANVS